MTKSVASAFIDRSISALSGSSELLFPATTFGSIQERIIFNPNTSNAIWINLTGVYSSPQERGLPYRTPMPSR